VTRAQTTKYSVGVSGYFVSLKPRNCEQGGVRHAHRLARSKDVKNSNAVRSRVVPMKSSSRAAAAPVDPIKFSLDQEQAARLEVYAAQAVVDKKIAAATRAYETTLRADLSARVATSGHVKLR
jgi:hypothetical protein